MHIYGKDQQAFHLQRTQAETWWSRLNTLIVIVQLACFLSAIIRTGTNASNSMSNSLFINSVLALKSPYLVSGCVYNVTRTHAFFSNVQYQLSPDNVGYFVSRGVLNIRYLMAITVVQVVVSAVNKVWFETNTHEIRYHFVVFRKDMVTTWEVLLIVLGFVMTLGVTKENQIMTDYVTQCAGAGTIGTSFYHSVQPYTELIVSYIVSMAFTVINALFAIWNLSKENPRDAMLREAEERQREWKLAMQKYYGITDPDAATAAAAAATQAEGTAGGTQPQVIYADNRGATVDPAAPPGAAAPPASQSPGQQQQTQHGRHHGYHHAIRKGLGHPFNALTTSLRRRSHAGEALEAGGGEVPAAAAAPAPPATAVQPKPSPLTAQLPGAPLPQRGQPAMLRPSHEPPHVGPSVSRPLTPLLNEEYDNEAYEMPEVRPQQPRAAMGRGNGANGRVATAPAAMAESSSSGRYDLHEVADDEEPVGTVDVDITNSSPHGGGGGGGSGRGGGGDGAAVAAGAGRGRVASGSDASTALIAARLAGVPPPPPVYSGDRRQRAPMNRATMLAPPSPLQGGAETTDDTVHL